MYKYGVYVCVECLIWMTWASFELDIDRVYFLFIHFLRSILF